MRRDGILSESAVRSLVENKQDEDKYEYGHGQHADSWVGAELPKGKNLDSVFREGAASNLVDQLESYESIYLYYIPESEWKAHFCDNEKKIEKISMQVKKLNEELDKHTEEALQENGINNWVERKSKEENIFVACPDCKSRIHAPSLLWATRQTPERCPVCRSSNSGFSDLWREELFGKRYVSKRNKILNEINELNNEIKELRDGEQKEIRISELDKKGNEHLKDKVRTLIAVDIHH